MSNIFQSFWWGAPLSPYEWLCLKSFVAKGHTFELFSYDPALSVPQGVKLRDASLILKESEFFTYSDGPGKGSPSAFSNLFRYKLLYDRGGWWVDTDVICVSADVPAYDRFFALEDPEIINSAIMCFERSDPVMERCFTNASSAGKGVRWGETGPRLITKVVHEFELAQFAQDAQLAYPIHFTEIAEMFRPSSLEALLKKTERSHFVHLWNEGFRRLRISKRSLPPRGSWLRGQIDAYAVGGWEGEYTSETFETSAEVYKAAFELQVMNKENKKLKRECRAQARTIRQMRKPLRSRLAALFKAARRFVSRLRDT